MYGSGVGIIIGAHHGDRELALSVELIQPLSRLVLGALSPSMMSCCPRMCPQTPADAAAKNRCATLPMAAFITACITSYIGLCGPFSWLNLLTNQIVRTPRSMCTRVATCPSQWDVLLQIRDSLPKVSPAQTVEI